MHALAVTPDVLDPAERAALAAAERTIQRGLKTFIEVGEALLEIRDRRLYRDTHPTFEDYLADRWGISKRHGNRLIQSAEVARIVGPIGPIPATESQARELAPLLPDPDSLRDVWTRVMAQTGRPTAAAIRAVREEVTAPDAAAADPEPTPEPKGDEEPSPTGEPEPAPEVEVEPAQAVTVDLRLARAQRVMADPAADPAALRGALEQLLVRTEQAQAAIERIWSLHVMDAADGQCRACRRPYPCPTIRALDGEV
jgi:hypothetical protein